MVYPRKSDGRSIFNSTRNNIKTNRFIRGSQLLLALMMFTCCEGLADATEILEMDQFITYGRSIEISGDGQIVVGPTAGGTNTAPTYWTPTAGFVSVVDPEGRVGSFIGISRDGSTFSGTGIHDSFLYSTATGFIDLQTTSGVTDTTGLGTHGVSANGNVVVGTQVHPSNRADVWETVSGTWTEPTVAVGINSNAAMYAVSDNGLVAVGSYRSGSDQAARWQRDALEDTDWTVTVLTTGTGNIGSAEALSADGSIVYGVTPDNHAFQWTTTSGLIDVNGSHASSNLWATTADGQFAGGMYSDAGTMIAAVWDATDGWRSVESLMLDVGFDSGDIPMNLNAVSAVSSDGRYLVASTSGANASTYWIDLGQPLSVTSVPEPSTAIALTMLLPLAMVAGRRL